VSVAPTATANAARLTARTVALDSPPDLIGFAASDGLLWRDDRGGLAARGVALRLELPRGLADPASVQAVGAALAAIEANDEVGLPGCGPVAIGALPFRPDAPGELVVPREVLGVGDGVAWATTIGDPGEPPVVLERSPGAGLADVGPDRFELGAAMSHTAWKQMVDKAVAAVRAGRFEKVVLARRVDVTGNRPIVVPEVLGRLAALYPTCMVFSVDRFLGASPELLVERRGTRIRSHPLAGTVARSGDPSSDDALVAALLASEKERWEHRLVVDSLAEALRGCCDQLDVPDVPSVLALRNVSHLATTITGRLLAVPGEPRPSAFELAARIHPTAAIGGTPADAAIRYLQSVEGFDRGRYGGPVGWVDARGDGSWALGIRSADVEGARARLYAGVGVVADSVAEGELAETQLKLQALLAAIVRP
jgi:menaquinone-specific isochorismate synthase